MTKDNQEIINELHNEVEDLITRYVEKLPPYEVGFIVIRRAVNMLLCCAPNEDVGLKTILACVETGLTDYKEIHS